MELCWQGKSVAYSRGVPLEGRTPYEREGGRRYAIGAAFFLAYQSLTGNTPPWGMLTGVRPDKLVTEALTAGKTPGASRELLEKIYYVTPRRAALALETGTAAFKAAKSLGPRDIAVYIGVPFCPTRCAYCSFVSQSVEKSFSLVDPGGGDRGRGTDGPGDGPPGTGHVYGRRHADNPDGPAAGPGADGV